MAAPPAGKVAAASAAAAAAAAAWAEGQTPRPVIAWEQLVAAEARLLPLLCPDLDLTVPTAQQRARARSEARRLPPPGMSQPRRYTPLGSGRRAAAAASSDAPASGAAPAAGATLAGGSRHFSPNFHTLAFLQEWRRKQEQGAAEVLLPLNVAEKRRRRAIATSQSSLNRVGSLHLLSAFACIYFLCILCRGTRADVSGTSFETREGGRGQDKVVRSLTYVSKTGGNTIYTILNLNELPAPGRSSAGGAAGRQAAQQQQQHEARYEGVLRWGTTEGTALGGGQLRFPLGNRAASDYYIGHLKGYYGINHQLVNDTGRPAMWMTPQAAAAAAGRAPVPANSSMPVARTPQMAAAAAAQQQQQQGQAQQLQEQQSAHLQAQLHMQLQMQMYQQQQQQQQP
jgi:hypothetical protein